MTKETKDMMEEALVLKLGQLGTLDGEEEEYLLNDIRTLTELLNKCDQTSVDEEDKAERRRIEEERNLAEVQDKEERRRIEEERNAATAEIEMRKHAITFGKVLLEVGGKIVLPLLISFLAHKNLQGDLTYFEQTGRPTSAAWRGLNLPRIWK